MARKTSFDYRKELADINLKREALIARIISRARVLCNQHPDVQIGYTIGEGGENIPHCTGSVTKADMTVSEAIYYIETIEKYLADQHPHKQGNLF